MKKVMAVILMISLLLASGACAENAAATLQDLYAQAELAMALGDYSGAGAKFEALGAYSDASQMAMYCKAVAAAETLGAYDVAISAFDALDDFRDCKQMSVYYQGRKAQATAELFSMENITDEDLNIVIKIYQDAIEIYSGLALFKDCLTRVGECKNRMAEFIEEREARIIAKLEQAYQEALALEEKGEYKQAIDAFTEIKGYKDSEEHISACRNAIFEEKYQNALTLEKDGKYQQAIDAFLEIEDYKDSEEHITACRNAILEATYQDALLLEQQKNYKEAFTLYRSVENYKDSPAKMLNCFQQTEEPFEINYDISDIGEGCVIYSIDQGIGMIIEPLNIFGNPLPENEFRVRYEGEPDISYYYKLVDNKVHSGFSDLPNMLIYQIDTDLSWLTNDQ